MRHRAYSAYSLRSSPVGSQPRNAGQPDRDARTLRASRLVRAAHDDVCSADSSCPNLGTLPRLCRHVDARHRMLACYATVPARFNHNCTE